MLQGPEIGLSAQIVHTVIMSRILTLHSQDSLDSLIRAARGEPLLRRGDALDGFDVRQRGEQRCEIALLERVCARVCRVDCEGVQSLFIGARRNIRSGQAIEI